jgi:hypothetical protein
VPSRAKADTVHTGCTWVSISGVAVHAGCTWALIPGSNIIFIEKHRAYPQNLKDAFASFDFFGRTCNVFLTKIDVLRRHRCTKQPA